MYVNLHVFLFIYRRVLEILTSKRNLSNNMRSPAISRLQKVHNMEVVYKALIADGLNLEKSSKYTIVNVATQVS